MDDKKIKDLLTKMKIQDLKILSDRSSKKI